MSNRYEGFDHHELRDLVADGEPDDVTAVAVVWSTLTEVTGQLADDLRRDLDILAVEWSGSDSERYRSSVHRIEQSCRVISDGATKIASALTLMAERLEEIKRAIEEEYQRSGDSSADEREYAPGTVGSQFGYQIDETTTRDARQRAVEMIAELDDWLEDRGMMMRDPGESGYHDHRAAGAELHRPGERTGKPGRQRDGWKDASAVTRIPWPLDGDMTHDN